MKTPADKIRPDALHQNDIIQIIVTTSCDILTCSSCTQLLVYRKDARFMDIGVFRTAVQSLRDWPGVVALFGGNPCSHPHFDDLCAILEEEVPEQRRRGLWTNNLLGNGEVARRTFWPHGRFNLNVHQSSKAADEMREWLPGITILGEHTASWHSPILMNWEDMGLTQAQWIAARENCDVNQRWSAGIAQRGRDAYGYFCEIAAALDGIRGENHGLLARPGWWKLPISVFDEQIRQCCDRGCGIPLKYRGHLDNAETYDVSKTFVPITQSARLSAKVKQMLHESPPESTAIATDYQRLFSE